MKMLIAENTIKRQIYVSVIVITLTAMVLVFVFNKKTTSTKPIPSHYIPTVRFITAQAQDLTISLQARGIIEPEKQITLVAQVVGTVTDISDKFETGSSFRKGDILLQADTTYLNMELQKARAAYNQAAFHELEVKAQIEAGSMIEDAENNSELAQGKPLLSVASSAREAALAAMHVAQKQMDNATLYAPFNGRVMVRNIQEQEQLIIGRPLGQIYSTDSYRIRFPLTQEQFAMVDVPSPANTGSSPLLISNEATQQQWHGKILHSEGFIAANRMIYLIAEVLPGKSAMGELMPGSLLKIDMAGKLIHNVFLLPASALHDNNTVWILTTDNRLQEKPVKLLHRGADNVYINSGLGNGDRVVISQIAGATENMLVNPQNTDLPTTDTIKDSP